MKIIKVPPTKSVAKATTTTTTKPLSRRERSYKRALARKMANRSSFEPVKKKKPTNSLMKKRASAMRRQPTPAEHRMSERLTDADIVHATQVVIGWYIADILIRDKMLIVELDGAHHYTDNGSLSDFRRTKWLQQFGFTVLRCANSDVEQFDITAILNTPKTVKPSACGVAIKQANKERNRALYYPPVQQEQYKAKRKRKYPTERWQDVPNIDERGRIIR